MVRGIINFIYVDGGGRQLLADILCVLGWGPHNLNEITTNGVELAWDGRRNKNTRIWSGSMMMLGVLSWSATAGFHSPWLMVVRLEYFRGLPQNETMHDRHDCLLPYVTTARLACCFLMCLARTCPISVRRAFSQGLSPQRHLFDAIEGAHTLAIQPITTTRHRECRPHPMLNKVSPRCLLPVGGFAAHCVLVGIMNFTSSTILSGKHTKDCGFHIPSRSSSSSGTVGILSGGSALHASPFRSPDDTSSRFSTCSRFTFE